MFGFDTIIYVVIELLTWLVIIKVILSYFVPPYHQVREMLDRLLEPLLRPIRQVMPQSGMADFSPLVLILILRVVGVVLTRLF